jgi:hypothetical protein
MNPRLSMSKDRDLVNGSVGEPAMTTTSVRPPFLARFALLVLRMYLLVWYPLNTTVPQVTIRTAVRILCRDTQS